MPTDEPDHPAKRQVKRNTWQSMVSHSALLHLILHQDEKPRRNIMSNILEQPTTNRPIIEGNGVDIRRILVPVDLSEHSAKTASYAVALAKAFEAAITFVHVFPPEAITEFTTEDVHAIYEQERDIAKQRLASFGKKIGRVYPECATEFRIGDTAEQVKLAALELEADLIITASYRPGFLGRLFGLEQAPRIVNHAPCPVLVYHEPQEQL
jgi:nucleotide-binding universal stress UspA family protein